MKLAQRRRPSPGGDPDITQPMGLERLTRVPRLRLPRVMRHRSYRLAWSGVFVSNIGTWMESIGVTTYVTRVTGEAKWTATVAALLFLPAIFLGPIGGALADRFDRRWYLRIMTGVQIVLAAALMALVMAHRLSVPAVAVVMTLSGCASALVGPAFTALVVDFVPAEDVIGAVNMNSAQYNLARIVGPALAAPVIKFGGLGWVFGLNTLSFVAVLIALDKVDMGVEHSPARTGAIWTGIRTGLRAASLDAGIRTALLITLLASFFISPFIGLSSVFAMHILGRDEAAAAWLVVAQGLGAILLAFAVVPLSERFGRWRVLKVCCAALGPLCALYWLAPGYGWSLLFILFLGAMHLGVVTGCSSVCQSRAQRGMRARVGSLFSLVVAAGYAPGLPVLGVLGDEFGLRWVAVIGAALFLSALVNWRFLRPDLFRRMDAPMDELTLPVAELEPVPGL